MRAAVMTRPNGPLELMDLDLDAPRGGELRIRLGAAGVCHSDASIRAGHVPYDPPVVLGHEAAGLVVETGPGVTNFEPGDHVVLSIVPQCGTCRACGRNEAHLCEVAAPHILKGTLLDGSTRLRSRGSPVGQAAFIGAFAEEAVVPSIAAVKIPSDLPWTEAALLGCAVLTGTGAARNTAHLANGDSAVIVGVGGVGLNIVQGARIAGASTIIAVDVHAGNLHLAEKLGATHAVNASLEDPVARVRQVTEGGADVGFEAAGRAGTLEQIPHMVRRGGHVVLVGMPPPDVLFPVPVARMLASAQRVEGCAYGSSRVRRDIPELVKEYRLGNLQLAPLISSVIGLEEVDAALAELGLGVQGRTVIDFDLPS